MLSRSFYRLTRETVSLETIGSRKRIVRIPKDAVLEVLSVRNGPEGHPMAEVRWLGTPLEMFAVDLERRDEAILVKAATR
jgi:hypothetical protein